MRDDGGQAFPGTSWDWEEFAGPGEYVPHGTDGMSLRDWFAGMASDKDLEYWRDQAIAEVGLGGNVREAARYLHADAMLEERQK